MASRHNFSKARILREIEAAASAGALEVMVQTQTEMQQLLSTPGRGRVYAKNAAGARRLDGLIAPQVGTRKGDVGRIEAARSLHTAFRGRGNFRPESVIGAERGARRAASRQFYARRVGVTLTDAQIAGLLVRPRGGRFRNLGEANLHRASAPGDPPAVRTGHLRRTVGLAKPKRAVKGNAKGWRITIKLEYAKPLEYGTSRMAERPYVRPALAKMKPVAPRMIAARIRLAGFSVR